MVYKRKGCCLRVRRQTLLLYPAVLLRDGVYRMPM
jgi:hypothetical protein